MRLATTTLALLTTLASAAFGQPGGLPVFERPEDKQTPPAQITLKVGDAAPALNIFKWFSGEPVASLEPGKAYIVEFFVSENSPTTRNITAMNTLQAKYKDRGLRCIGVSAEEGGLKRLQRMATRMGDRLGYAIGYDDRRQTYRNWIVAAGRRDYPAAFLVNQEGKIVWSGRTMFPWGELDEVVASVLDKSYTPENAAVISRRWDDRRKSLLELLERLNGAITAGQGQEALSVIDELVAKDPSMSPELTLARFTLQLQTLKDIPGAYKTASEAVDGALKDDEAGLNIIAYSITTTPNLEPRDLDLALRAAQRAETLTGGRDYAVLDALAAVHFERQEYDKAIEAETRALNLVEDQQIRDEISATLKKFNDAKSAGKPG